MPDGLTREQRQVLRKILEVGRSVGASPKELKAAVETGLVESNLRNLDHGDADSQGWRQERASLYPDPTNLDASIKRFFNETRAVKSKYSRAGDLAAAVQRPAAQYRGRYQQRSGDAEELLRQYAAAPAGGTPRKAAPRAPGATRTITETVGGVDNKDARGALVASFLQGGDSRFTAGTGAAGMESKDPVQFALALRALKDVAGQQVTRTVRDPDAPAGTPATSSSSRASGSGADRALSWATSKVGDPGSRETGGENRGKLADYANSRFGMSGQPWCAMFTSMAVTKGGAPASARTASVPEVRRKALAGEGYHKGLIDPRRARPGDLILFGGRHIGMVQRVANGKIHYVGGNQSDSVTEAATPIGKGDIVRPKYGARNR